MASSAANAPSTGLAPLQIAVGRRLFAVLAAVEGWLEAERDQLVLWIPVALGAGVTAWFILPDPRAWIGTLLALAGVALAALAIGRGGRAGRALAIGAVLAALGIALVWWRAERVAAPVLARPAIATMAVTVEAVEPLPARDLVRLTVRLFGGDAPLPPRFRINLVEKDAGSVQRGAAIRLRGRLMPPPTAAVPGAYDFARTAWFAGIGATGRGFAPVTILAPGKAPAADFRARLSRHVQSRIDGSAGAIAATLATGDRGAIADDDAEAMRRAGLAHLLAISGLHVSAVIGAVMLLVSRLLALSPWLALRVRVPVVAAGAGAVAAIGYTVLTGAQVPTVRACIAALLILTALVMGREALTLRLVATGAVIVLLAWPETLAGPSFQLSFTAVTVIVALHEHPAARTWFARRAESPMRRIGRALLSLFLTGLAVEIALAPIALYHFHKSGLYGALANIVAIPLTTFVVMPLEALALLLDLVGLGAPCWWLTGQALDLLLRIARATAAAPGAVAALPGMPDGAFALMVLGGLWLLLWRTPWRRLGALPLIVGASWAALTPPPDLLVTGDGRHVAIRTADGKIALLRDRSGDYTRSMLAENGGIDDDPVLLSDQRDARCSRDLCLASRHAGGRTWRILATRSPYLVPINDLIAACRSADIVVSERRLPRGCTPHWLRLDRPTLTRTGGVAITFASGHIATVFDPGDQHPWRQPPLVAVSRSGGAARRAFPARVSGAGRNAADHRRGWRDQAGSSSPRA